MVITQRGIMIRLPVEGISKIGRNTQGVRLINLDEGDKVIDITRVAKSKLSDDVDGTNVPSDDEQIPNDGNGIPPHENYK